MTIDQERRGVAVYAGDGSTVIDLAPPPGVEIGDWLQDYLLEQGGLPEGGGLVIGDAQVWGVITPTSVSQYTWASQEQLDWVVRRLAERGYTATVIPNKVARVAAMWYEAKLGRVLTKDWDVIALWHYAFAQMAAGGTFDSGHPYRTGRDGTAAREQRAVVTRAFLRLQNFHQYSGPVMEAVTAIAWDALDAEGRELFGFLKTMPKVTSPNKLAAVAVCTHDPDTGLRREYQGRPWGMQFITRYMLGLNGTVAGTGSGGGSPMRAVMRGWGRANRPAGHPENKNNAKLINRDKRAALDRHTRVLIRALQQHEDLRATRPTAAATVSRPDETAGAR